MQPLITDDEPTPLPALTIDRSLGFVQPAIRDAYLYWQRCRGLRPMPSRADLDPAGMRAFLANVGLVEVDRRADAAPDYRIRLAGTKAESIFGPITGKRLGEFLTPPLEERWRAAFEAVIAERMPLRFASRVAFEDKGWLDMETMLAPLSDDGNEVAMLFGAFTAWSARRG